MAQSSALCFPSNRSATAGAQASQRTTAQTHSNSPPLEEPAVGVGVIPAARSSPVVDPLETGPPLSSKRHDMASTARVMGPACVAAQREPFGLPKRVLNTMAEARTPSTRCFYALKWSVFSTWCQDHNLDLVTSDVSGVSMPLFLADRWAEYSGSIFTRRILRVLVQLNLGTYLPY